MARRRRTTNSRATVTVPVVVALVGAGGAVLAAVVAGLFGGGSGSGPSPPGPSPPPSSAAVATGTVLITSVSFDPTDDNYDVAGIANLAPQTLIYAVAKPSDAAVARGSASWWVSMGTRPDDQDKWSAQIVVGQAPRGKVEVTAVVAPGSLVAGPTCSSGSVCGAPPRLDEAGEASVAALKSAGPAANVVVARDTTRTVEP